MLLSLFFTLHLLLPFSACYKVLFLVPFPAPSHWLWCKVFAEELVNRGHEVTAVTNYKMKQPHPNYTELILDPMFDIPAYFPIPDIFNLKYDSDLNNIMLFFRSGLLSTEHAFKDPKVQNLIKPNNLHFDVIVMEQFFHDGWLLFSHRYKAPIVTIGTLGHADYYDRSMGLITPWAYVPNNMLTYDDQMTFLQRCYNVALSLLEATLYRFHYMTKMQQMADKYFIGLDEPVPSILELEKNISIRLVNSHSSTSHPRPSMPGLINVAGAHIKDPKPLPADIQKFLDDASDTGAIFFSLGSYVKSVDMPRDKLNAFLETFAKLKQKVLWKYEDESIKNLPLNVMIRKWLPQSDILAHKNLILFITHGGVFGKQEGLYHGVPMLMIPFYGDQFRNSIKSVVAGYAVMLKFTDVTTRNLTEKLNLMLNNKEYALRAREKSILFRDNPISPLDESMHWIEYVARHQGASHLRSSGADMPWFIHLNLDILGALFIVIFIVVKVIMMLCRMVNSIDNQTQSAISVKKKQ